MSARSKTQPAEDGVHKGTRRRQECERSCGPGPRGWLLELTLSGAYLGDHPAHILKLFTVLSWNGNDIKSRIILPECLSSIKKGFTNTLSVAKLRCFHFTARSFPTAAEFSSQQVSL